jgi:hypothetical protein
MPPRPSQSQRIDRRERVIAIERTIRAMASPLSPSLTPCRAEALEVREVPDGFVVYDGARDRLHYLNGTAAFVLESCDGSTPVAAIPPLVAAAFGLDTDPVDEVTTCVQRLLSEGLLVPAAHPGNKPV